MKHSLRTGIVFGLTSGVITTLGLMVGLASGTNSRTAVIGGILTIAIADAFSDALGIHISEESKKRPEREVWESTISTFLSKFFFALTFVVPVLLSASLSGAVYISVGWGLLMLSVLSYFIAREENEAPWKVIGEHLFIAVLVVVLSHYVGNIISSTFS